MTLTSTEFINIFSSFLALLCVLPFAFFLVFSVLDFLIRLIRRSIFNLIS